MMKIDLTESLEHWSPVSALRLSGQWLQCLVDDLGVELETYYFIPLHDGVQYEVSFKGLYENRSFDLILHQKRPTSKDTIRQALLDELKEVG